MSTETTVSELQGETAVQTPEQAYDALVKANSEKPSIEFDTSFISANFFSDYVEMDLGKNVKKCLSYPDFRKILNNVVHEESKEELPGILPPSNIIFFSQNAKEIRLTCYYPSSIRTLHYANRKREIVTPNMIISHILGKDGKDWIVKSSRYFCTDNPVSKLPKTFIYEVNHGNRIYLSAMSNTYADAKMCFGNNSMPVRFKDDNLRGLDYYYKFLWETAFNDDLGIAAISRGSYVNEWYQTLVDAATEKKKFPYERLVGWTKHPDGIIAADPIR